MLLGLKGSEGFVDKGSKGLGFKVSGYKGFGRPLSCKNSAAMTWKCSNPISVRLVSSILGARA